MAVTPGQIRAALALLRIEQEELARQAQVSVATIRRIEAAEGGECVALATLQGVQRVLEQAGAEFIAYGVRRRQPPRGDAADLYLELQAISERSAAQCAGRPPLSEADLYDEEGPPA